MTGLLDRTFCTSGPWWCQWPARQISSHSDLAQEWFQALSDRIRFVWLCESIRKKRSSVCLPAALQGKVFHLSRGRCAQHHQQVRLSAGQLQMGQTQVQLWQPWPGLLSLRFVFFAISHHQCIEFVHVTALQLLSARLWCLCLFWRPKTAG